ncbi:MAG: hypothetical protein K2O02_01975 [Lachnospiraceae bacterium]|nr:hypothetical protein [Lachnospiraceae bacterium]
MRLIDADKFKQQIAAIAVKNNYDVHVANKLCEIIDVQPTAIIVPEKMEVCGTYGKGDIPASYKVGWNACIDQILKCMDYVPETNADRIRKMTNKELAELLERFELGDIDYAVTFCDLCKEDGNELNLDCSGCLRHWLESGCDAE